METADTAGEHATQDFVVLTLPADGAYLSVLRTATAGLAARLDFTLDEIEDLRIAVDEACALLLNDARPGTTLACRFELDEHLLRVTVSASSRTGRLPTRETFAWTVLTSLVDDVEAEKDSSGTVTVRLLKRKGPFS